jgi:hypothetical protein
MKTNSRTAWRWVIAVLLVLAGAAAALCGVGAWTVSGCCGSPEPAEDGYLLVGGVVAIALWGGAYCLLARRSRPPNC